MGRIERSAILTGRDPHGTDIIIIERRNIAIPVAFYKKPSCYYLKFYTKLRFVC